MSKTTYYLVLFFLTTVFAVWEGFVLSCMWGWFIVPIFKLPELTLIPASGVTLIFGIITRTDHSASAIETNILLVLQRAVIDSIQTPLFILVIGRFLSFFM